MVAESDSGDTDDAFPKREAVIVTPVGRETHEWAPRAPEIYSQAEVRRQTGAYESAVAASIANQRLDIPSALAADIEDATRALLDFDTYVQRVLGTSDASLGPMSAILLRTESSSSSQIEQLTTSSKQLALAEIGEGRTGNAIEVMGNVRAMEAALELSERIDGQSILAMHEKLLNTSPTLSQHAGKWRSELVWIGGDNAGPRRAAFVAPQYGRVPSAIADVVAFAGRVDVPALAQIATAHAQFETIHPFVDGNGRTGRALVQAMLRHRGIARNITVPLSAGLLVNTESYFAALSSYRDGDAGPIIRRFADASRYAAATGKTLVDGLAAQLWVSRDLLDGVRRQAWAWKVLPHLVEQPVMSTKYLKRKFAIRDETAIRALETLAERGVLAEKTGAKRNRVWEHKGILSVLDDYAASIRRSTMF